MINTISEIYRGLCSAVGALTIGVVIGIGINKVISLHINKLKKIRAKKYKQMEERFKEKQRAMSLKVRFECSILEENAFLLSGCKDLKHVWKRNSIEKIQEPETIKVFINGNLKAVYTINKIENRRNL